MSTPVIAPSIATEYRARFPRSLALWERARHLVPSGINHDVRRIVPFPLYMDHAQGCRKWDVDGNEFLDLCTGHGALMLGHSHPAIVKAIQQQAERFTHPSAPTPLEVQWAELVTRLVPCAEMVRFLLSGTEATLLAMRLSRAHTGRDVVVKIHGHFHGWHDYAMIGYMPPFDVPSSNGVPGVVGRTMRAVPLDDLDAMDAALRPGDVAAVILEADGPLAGTVPVQPGYLAAVRELTARHSTLLVFDEVVTGFRLAPGGAQQYFGVVPDLATFAKIVAGGMPSGAVAGRAEIMSDIAFRDDPDWNRRKRVRHMGTFSAYPLAAAAGVTALELLADGSLQDRAAALADRLRSGMNQALAEARVAGSAYGCRSILRIIVGDDLPAVHGPAEFVQAVPPARLIESIRPPVLHALHAAMLLEGLDVLGGSHAWTSAVMTEADIDDAVSRFARALRRVTGEGLLTPGR
ncbi:MAG: aspartate aminotransferase family protein [Actinomycetota bacterium]